jgi:TPR repeat protein
MNNRFLDGGIALLLSFSLWLPAHAGPFEDGDAAYRAGDYKRAREIWTPLAVKGDARAQHALGRNYEKGRGVSRDFSEALRWYRLAADQGHPDAQYRVSAAYALGVGGVSRDLDESAKWLHKAAESGHKKSQRLLAQAYNDEFTIHPMGYMVSDVIKPDKEKAAYWKARSQQPNQ